MNLYTQAACLTLRDGGDTFTRDGVPVETHTLRGYTVGGIVPTAIIGRAGCLPVEGMAFLASCLAAFVAGHAATFNADPSLFLGTWVSDDNVYIDVVEFIGNEAEALRTARERGELAVWDCKAGCAIPVQEEGVRHDVLRA